MFAWSRFLATGDDLEWDEDPLPFVCDGFNSKALHFSIGATQSQMRCDDPSALVLAYTKTMMGFLVFKPDPADIVMIGLGGGSLPKFCYRYLPSAVIKVVEINPRVIELRGEFRVPPDDERFAVVHGDGCDYVRQMSERCDVLLVDGFDASGLPERLSSQGFYDSCHEKLRPSGVMVANLDRDDSRYEVQLARIRRSFAFVVMINDFWQSNSIVFAASERPDRSDHRDQCGSPGAEQLRTAFERVASAILRQRP